MSTIEAIQFAKHLREHGTLPGNAPMLGKITLGLLQALDEATELKDRLVLDARANKVEADTLRAAFRWFRKYPEFVPNMDACGQQVNADIAAARKLFND